MMTGTGSALSSADTSSSGSRASRFAKAETLDPEEAKQIALDAYVYGYSLITTDVTRVQMSNVAIVEELRAPTGTFFNIKRYPPATIAACPRRTPTPSTRSRGSICPSPRCSAIRRSRIASSPLNWSICG